ncbi:MAG: sigma-70 family RNA polymerase sigma factor [Bacteroidota bacterium]
MTEKALVRKCTSGEKRAQKELYETYYMEMKRLVMRYLPNENDAFDCLSQGFCKALTKIGQFNYSGAGSLGAWIRKIMVNESLQKLRESSRMAMVLNLEATEPTDFFYEASDASYIYECIQELPDGARTVFNLVAIEGYSHKEVAAQLHISEGTSRSQLLYARNKLKMLLEKME